MSAAGTCTQSVGRSRPYRVDEDLFPPAALLPLDDVEVDAAVRLALLRGQGNQRALEAEGVDLESLGRDTAVDQALFHSVGAPLRELHRRSLAGVGVALDAQT